MECECRFRALSKIIFTFVKKIAIQKEVMEDENGVIFEFKFR
jgi:hypothetical protein